MTRDKNIKIAYLLLFIFMTTTSIATAAEFDRGEIVFEKGKSSETYSGTLLRGDFDLYNLVAGAGQWMEVKISSLEDNAVFQLSIYQYGTGEDISLMNAGEGDDAKYWYGQLPSPGYSKDGQQNIVDFGIGGTRGNATYKLQITIRNTNWR